MNFRTTVILLVLLLGGLAFVYFVNRSPAPDKTKEEFDPKGVKVFSVVAGDVDKLTLRPANGPAIELLRQAGKWTLTQPLNWPASDFEANDLVESVVGLRSHGHPELTSESAASVGLDKPRYMIEFTGKDGKGGKLAVGNRSALGNDLFVKVDDKSVADVVSGGKLATELDKSSDKLIAGLRDKQLVRIASTDVKQIELDVKGKKLVLHKEGDQWKIVEPQALPAENSEVSDILFSLTGLRADEFVNPTGDEVSAAQLDQPKVVAWISNQAPSTQPSTQPVARTGGTIVSFGEFTNVDKDKIYVKVSDPASIATAAMTQVSLDKLTGANVLSLRDRKVADIKPAEVSKIVIKSDLPATTQPTTKPAKQSETIIQRHKQSLLLGPQLPAGPATAPGTPPIPVPKPAPAPTSIPTTRPSTGPHAASVPAVKPQTPAVAPVVTVPATQPASHPAVAHAASLPAATTKAVAATQAVTAATEPAIPAHPTPLVSAAPWELLSGPKGDADSGQVDALLKLLNPLKAEKYVATAPAATQPAPHYTVDITTEGAGGASVAHYLIQITDPGGEKPLVAQYNGLTFEVSRDLLKSLEGDFKTPQPAAAPEAPHPVSPMANPPFSFLGDKSILTAAQIEEPRSILEAFPNPKPERDFEVKFIFPEFTSMCPVTAQPDFATITITYIPDRLCVEMKSLKLYFLAYRNKGIFYEGVVNTILDDLLAVLSPRRMTVIGDFAPRGGTAGIITASFATEKKS